ncbi:MAG: site-specific integrase, partial [Bacteroidales bacterium]|nr:site-specific integrase [Bacteroidales bacterium]
KTIAEYDRLLSIINPKIGHYKLMNIKPLVLVEFYNAMRNRPGKKRLSETSILRYYALINAIFNKAVKWDLIRVNPNEKLDKPKREKHEARYYDVDQTKSLLDALESENIRNKTLIRLAIDTGARRGELTGLEWEDINFKNNSININKVTQAGRGIGVIEKKPKNDSSIRRVFMTDHTAQLLQELKKHQKMLEKEFGSQWKGSKKIFTSTDGNRIHPDRPSQILKEIIRKNNLADLPFHGLRHTSVSLLIAAGVHTQVISKRVGHSSSATTRDIYSHVFETSEKEAVGKLDTILN